MTSTDSKEDAATSRVTTQQQLQPEQSEESKLFHQVPVINLDVSNTNTEADIAKAIYQACSTYGFFQIVSHDINVQLIESFQQQCQQFFDLPMKDKYALKRHGGNARGFFDDELTKQKVDWKQCLDVGRPGSTDSNKPNWNILPDNHPHNACLDGYNQFPSHEVLPEFRKVFVKYFEECAKLSHTIATYMARGLILMGCVPDDCQERSQKFLDELKEHHTSYLRTNYYPPLNSNEQQPPPLGISPHKDAGFLTVLVQDNDCHSLQVWYKNQWHTVTPIPGALTINTGDMAQIWSNGIYQAPLHRVLANTTTARYSAPFFYNPGYTTWVQPLVVSTSTSGENGTDHTNDSSIPDEGAGVSRNQPKYHPVLWGYFRAVRFAGDLTDLGVEIQIEDFERHNQDDDEAGASSRHCRIQDIFAKRCNFQEPFHVEQYRALLQSNGTDFEYCSIRDTQK